MYVCRATHCCAEIRKVTLTMLAQKEKQHKHVSPAFVGMFFVHYGRVMYFLPLNHPTVNFKTKLPQTATNQLST